MAIMKSIKKQSKGQLITMIMLIIFILMLAELFAFALLNITSNNIGQSASLSSSTSNYANLLKQSANSFAKESLTRALLTLANYEYNPNLRRVNFIENTSMYLSSLMVNGTLPNDTTNFANATMGDLKFTTYNSAVQNLLGYGGQVLSIGESTPVIFQVDPYHINVAYTENILLNVSGNNYNYNIPVNASVPLNGTLDLYSAEHHIYLPITFTNVANLTSIVGGVNAISANGFTYAYGTVFNPGSTALSSATCGSIPTAFTSPPFSSSLILATYNAMNMAGCENSYAGLISIVPPTALPTVPYLTYASPGILQSLSNGTKVLLYGPGYDTLNIEALRSAIFNNYFMASPFTPSYLDRAQGSTTHQSPNGVFTFSNYNTQAGKFDGATTNIIANGFQLLQPSNKVSVSMWVYASSLAAASDPLQMNLPGTSGGYAMYVRNTGAPGFGKQGGSFSSGTIMQTNKWYHLVGTYDGTNFDIYVNGTLSGQLGSSVTFSNTGPLSIGWGSDGKFNGQIANLQIYNTTINPAQVEQLYQQGISGVPLSDNALIGWWLLNGNANDYSGLNYNGSVNSVIFNIAENYSRDSIFQHAVVGKIAPIPGVLACEISGNCASSTLPNLYLGYQPLEMQNGNLQFANFPAPNYVSIPDSSSLDPSSAFTLSVWVNPSQLSVVQPDMLRKDSQYNLELSTTATVFSVYFGGAWHTATYNQPLPTSTWSSVTGVFTGTNEYLYVNGAQVASNGHALSTVTATANPLYLGHFGALQNGVLALGNVQMYSSALSAAQVSQLYRGGAADIPMLSANVVGWWPLGGNPNDYSGNANNGVGVNIIYPSFAGAYNSPGISSISTSVNEWQALGLANN